VLLATKMYSEALAQYRQAVAIDEGLSAADPEDDWARKYLVYNYLRLGDAQLKTGDVSAAQSTYERCLLIAKRRVDSDTTNAGALADLADSYARLGALNLSQGVNLQLAAGKRRSRLRSARTWYQQSLNVWLDMRNRGVLRGVQSHAPDQVAAELAKCESAMKMLGHPSQGVSEAFKSSVR
jgi:tetratricopeptide (TPR) repeat protein